MSTSVKRSPLATIGLIGAVCAALVGCGEPGGALPGTDGGISYEEQEARAQFVGRVHDPEVPFLGFLGCDGNTACEEAEVGVPLALDFDPLFNRAKTTGATVSVVAEPAGAALGSTTSENGDFSIPSGAPIRDEPYFLAAAGGVLVEDPDPSYGLDPIFPATRYVPTVALTPIYARTSLCILLNAYSLADTGILQAIAKHYGAPVAALTDGSRFGGVSVWMSYGPGGDDEQVVRIPGFGTRLTASQGEVLVIEWAPPGTPDVVNQSDRGFFVAAGQPTGTFGISAVVLPLAAAGTPVTVTPEDPVVSEPDLRPWVAPSQTMVLPTDKVAMGAIYFREDGAPPPAPLADPSACMIDAQGNF